MASFNHRRKLMLFKTMCLKALILRRRRRRKLIEQRKRAWWVHPCWINRNSEGAYYTLMETMILHDHDLFQNYVRMTHSNFKKLENQLRPALIKHNFGREALSVGHRLAITLRFLATGNSFRSIAYEFRVGFSTVAAVVKETCKAIWNTLQEQYLPEPTTDGWIKAADDYGRKWQYPYCCGAVDGKHILIQQPKNSGSKYLNYKGSNSIVLMAVVDANYRFLAVDIGGYGSQSDGGTFRASLMGQKLANETLGLPGRCVLPRSEVEVPHVLVGDEAFQLRCDFMRPYPFQALDPEKRIFNYRLSRARRCSENAFGILSQRWRVFRRPLLLNEDNTTLVVQACVTLHNYLTDNRNFASNNYCPPGYADFMDHNGIVARGAWRDEETNNPARGLAPLRGTNARRHTQEAQEVRETFKNYFSSEAGEVPWQWTLPGVPRV